MALRLTVFGKHPLTGEEGHHDLHLHYAESGPPLVFAPYVIPVAGDGEKVEASEHQILIVYVLRPESGNTLDLEAMLYHNGLKIGRQHAEAPLIFSA